MLGQGLERSIGQCGQQLVGARTLAEQVYGAVAIAPPFRFEQVGDLLLVETRPDQTSRHAADDRYPSGEARLVRRVNDRS